MQNAKNGFEDREGHRTPFALAVRRVFRLQSLVSRRNSDASKSSADAAKGRLLRRAIGVSAIVAGHTEVAFAMSAEYPGYVIVS